MWEKNYQTIRSRWKIRYWNFPALCRDFFETSKITLSHREWPFLRRFPTPWKYFPQKKYKNRPRSRIEKLNYTISQADEREKKITKYFTKFVLKIYLFWKIPNTFHSWLFFSNFIFVDTKRRLTRIHNERTPTTSFGYWNRAPTWSCMEKCIWNKPPKTSAFSSTTMRRNESSWAGGHLESPLYYRCSLSTSHCIGCDLSLHNT